MGNKNNYAFNINDIFQLGETSYCIKNRRIRELENDKWKSWIREYLCECLSCHNETWKSEKYIKRCLKDKNFIKGKGCNKCSSKHRVKEGETDIATTHPWLVKFFKDPRDATKISYGSGQRVSLKCPICGTEKEITAKQLTRDDTITCSVCGAGVSYPNRLGYCLLSSLGLDDFKNEYSDLWTEGKRYDFSFFVGTKHYLVEMDGTFHYQSGFYGQVDYKTTQLNDEYKDKLAKDHGCEIIRIDCRKSDFGYIKNNILNSKLADILDLSQVDWKKIKRRSVSSLLLEICRYYSTHPDASIYSMPEIFGLHSATIAKYLKKGTELQLVNYQNKNDQYRNDHCLIIDYIKEHGNVSVKQLADVLGLKDYSIRNHIKNAKLNNEINLEAG